MGVVQNIFAGRSPTGLALDFGAETITLLVRDATAPQGWSPLSAATVADDAFVDQIEALRSLAAEHSASCEVDLWLPADQVLNTHLELASSGYWGRPDAAKAALGDRTGLSPDEINLDLAKAPGDVWAICAAETKVVAEAQDYARRWGFAPNLVTTRHADAAFAAPPDLTGEVNRKPVLIGAGAAAAAAGVFLAVMVWPSAEVPLTSAGPERIVMAPATALSSPPIPEGEVVARSADAEGVVAVKQPAAPEPDYRKTAAVETQNDRFAASILSPSPQFPNFLSVDFSLPWAEDVTPIYANLAYRAPSLGHSPPSVEALEHLLPGKAPATGPSVLPSLRIGEGLSDPAARPSELGSFDVAALGPSPRALRTEDLIVQNDAIVAPEIVESVDENAAPVLDTPLKTAPAAEDVAAPEIDSTPSVEATPIIRNATDPRLAAPQPDVVQAPAAEDAAAPKIDSTPSVEATQIIQNATDPRLAAPQSDVVQAPEVEEAPGPGAVTAAPRPGKRPDSLDMSSGPGAVAAAPSARKRPKSIAPRPKAVARNTSSAKTVRAPSRGKPTGRGLANAATLKGAITLDQTSLLGVFGTSKNRRALIRLADGRMKRVGAGEVIDGWVVSRIQATSMRMTRGAEVRNLNLIR